MSKKKQQLFKLDTRPYRLPGYVIIDDDVDRAVKKVERLLGATYEQYTDNYWGRLCWNDTDVAKGFVILLKTKSGNYTIAHECFHAVRFILEKVAGLSLNDGSEEAYSYLIGELFHQIEKSRKK